MTARTRLLAFGLVALAGVALFASPALAQCSMCQQVVAQSPEAQRMSGELNRAILLMFVAPYVVFTSFILAFFRAPLGRRLRSLLRVFVLPR